MELGIEKYKYLINKTLYNTMKEEFYKLNKSKKLKNKINTFTVPIFSKRIEENITISTNRFGESSINSIINKAINYHSKGNISKAKQYYNYCINNGFNDSIIFHNYGILLQGLGELNEAEILARKAVKMQPKNALYYCNLGNILKDRGKLNEAEANQRKAIKLCPSLAISHSNLSNILKESGKLEEAEKESRQAIKLKPDFTDAYFNLSMIELLKGDYQSGLENYEYRWNLKEQPNLHGIPTIKRHDINNTIKGEKLLVIGEQAPGDVIFQMRYLLALKQQKIEFSFCTFEKLHSLIRDSGLDNNPISQREVDNIKEGKWVALGSLLKYFDVTPENPLINTPYISSTELLKKKWKKILSNEKKPIIGINWQGSKKLEQTSYKGRSVPLELFSILLKKNEISFLSLQKGFGTEQLKNCTFKDHFVSSQNLIDEIWDYSETCAIIENCDLVITIDCSVAALAAGTGKDVWLMLKKIPYWTWGLDGESTFWYPSMRLFRQKGFNNWEEVMVRVSIELNKLLS